MNNLVIMQTSQGLASYLEECLGESVARDRGIVIGYDHRKLDQISSIGLARITSAVFLSRGFKVFLLEDMVATPFVPFATTYLQAAAGIMVTASHNPKADNGFKVYWGNGSQIIPPHDQKIAESILENLAPWQSYDIDSVLSNPSAKNVTEEMTTAYFNQLNNLCQDRETNQKISLPVVYTAMHGVGAQWIYRAFEVFGHQKPYAVPSQETPDAEFRYYY
jgi:phosphomannomutase